MPSDGYKPQFKELDFEKSFTLRTDPGEKTYNFREFESPGDTQGDTPYRLPLQGLIDEMEPDVKRQLEEIPHFQVLNKVWQNLDFIPFFKYGREEDLDAFERMSPGDKAKDIAWEAFGATLWIAGGPITRAAFKGVKYGTQALGKVSMKAARKVGPKMKPIEDIGAWTSENYHKVAGRFLKKDLGLSTDEALGVVGALHGKPGALKDVIIRASPKPPSKKFMSMIQNVPGAPYVEYQLSNNALRGLADYSPQMVRMKHLQREFSQAVKKKQVFDKRAFDPFHAETVYKAQARRFFGKEGATGKTLANATEAELENFTLNMLDSPLGISRVTKMVRPAANRLISPVRRVFGKGEEFLQTHSRIYKVVHGAAEQANLYTGNKIAELQAMYAQAGFMKGGFGGKGFKRTKYFSQPVADWSQKIMTRRDELSGLIREATKAGEWKSVSGLTKEMEGLMTGIPSHIDKNSVAKLMDRTYSFFDKLYAERFVWKMGDLFEKAGLNSMGRGMSEKFRNDVASRIRYTFSSQGGKSYGGKVREITSIFEETKQILGNMKAAPGQSWFQAQGDDLGKLIDTLSNEFKFSSKGSFFHYLENYLPRLYQGETNAIGRIFGALGGKQRAFYTKSRAAGAGAGERLGLEQLIHSRIRAQAKEMHVYGKYEEVAKFAKTLPQEWRDYTEQYLARTMNLPSRGDAMVATLIEPSIGRVERVLSAVTKGKLGSEGVWTPRRVMRLSQNVNDITYMGFLGLKPFSAMRNLFQVPMNVAADLGGVTGIYHTAKGYGVLFDPAKRDYLKGIGIITDYAPELRRTGKIFSFRPKVLKVPIPMREEVRDVLMWMFQGSDKLNRFVTGGAAMSKWETAMTKSQLDKVNPHRFLNPTKKLQRRLDKFIHEAGVDLRNPWMKAELESTIMSGRLVDAKSMFVKDLVADTQYLYGGLDSPLIGHTMGAPGRTAAIFQSWYLNYAPLLSKWMTTGTLDQKLNRMLTWGLTNAAIFTVMERMWGTQTAVRSTFLGPFPTGSGGIPLPPAWEPFMDVAMIAGEMAQVAGGAKESEVVTKRLKALAWKTFSFAPAGLQLKQFIRGGKEEGAKGVAKAVIRWSPPDDE